jgi:hypothetical protein
MSEVEEALHNAARMGYKAAENGENLEDVLKDIKVTKGAKA